MSSRNYRSQFHYSYSPKPVSLRMAVSIGASGAPTIQSNTGMAINSIVRTSAGKYTINLSQTYAKLLGVRHSINSGASAPAAPSLYIALDHVATIAAPLVNIVMNAAGTPTDPASGEVILFEIILHDSSLGY